MAQLISPVLCHLSAPHLVLSSQMDDIFLCFDPLAPVTALISLPRVVLRTLHS